MNDGDRISIFTEFTFRRLKCCNYDGDIVPVPFGLSLDHPLNRFLLNRPNLIMYIPRPVSLPPSINSSHSPSQFPFIERMIRVFKESFYHARNHSHPRINIHAHLAYMFHFIAEYFRISEFQGFPEHRPSDNEDISVDNNERESTEMDEEEDLRNVFYPEDIFEDAASEMDEEENVEDEVIILD